MPRQRVLSSKLNHFRLPIILHEKQANKKQNIKLGGILTSSSLDTNSLHIRYKRLYSRPLCERWSCDYQSSNLLGINRYLSRDNRKAISYVHVWTERFTAGISQPRKKWDVRHYNNIRPSMKCDAIKLVLYLLKIPIYLTAKMELF